MEGWRDDGWQLEVDMLVEDGSLVHEEQRKSQIPDWSLTGDEVRQALGNTRDAGLQQFKQFDVDKDRHIEIEGHDAQKREIKLRLIKLRLNSSDLAVTGVEHD